MRAMDLAARILERGPVRLEPFEPHHREGLAAVAEADVDLFRHIPFPVAKRGYGSWFEFLRADQAAGRSIPHAVLLNGKIVGQSCYFVDPSTNLAETAFMVHPDWQGTGLGAALQRRMAEHARGQIGRAHV